jgi:hypothetical protein
MNRPSKQSTFTSVSYLLIGFLSLVIAFPLFIAIHKQVPEYNWPLYADRILMFLFVIVFALLLLSVFRPVINFIFGGALVLLLYGSFTETYGFKSLVTDYKSMFVALREHPDSKKTGYPGDENFYYKNEILDATNYNSVAVRNFALRSTNENFKKDQSRYIRYRNLIQSFAVFKKINRKWNYVDDPQGKEYFGRASESVAVLAGDCDDYAITMVAAIKSIGGEARFVSTTGHLYPEIKIGTKYDLAQITGIVKNVLFPIESEGMSLHYHVDKDENIWLNLDYTAAYPGGKFYAEEVTGILTPQ